MNIGKSIKSYSQFDNGLRAITERLLFRRPALQVLELGGRDILLDHRAADAGSILTCLTSDMYTGHLPEAAGIPINVLDLGANAGGFSLLALTRLNIKKLVAVELNPNTFRRTRFNLEDATVVALNRAVTADGRSITMPFGRGSTGDRIGAAGEGASRTVLGITLSEAVQMFHGERIHLCKMDIEGAEDEVLLAENAGDALSMIDHLLIELHHEDHLSVITAALATAGLRASTTVTCGVNSFRR